jgi:hypothetical protein
MAQQRKFERMNMLGAYAALALGPMALASGCVQVRAPDKPIEINLNVTIKQEVTLKLSKDVEDLVKTNPGGVF